MTVGPYIPLVAWSVVIGAIVEGIKRAADRAGLRGRPWFEVVLPLCPLVIGAVSGAAGPAMVGLEEIVAEPPTPAAGVFFGAGAGAVSGHTYKTVRELWKQVAGV